MPQTSQFSTFSSFTRLNSSALAVTIVAPTAWACAAISRSLLPIGFPAASSLERMQPYSASADTSKGRTAISPRIFSTALSNHFEPLFAQP